MKMISKTQTLRIICFLFIIVCADQITGRLLHKLYFTQRAGQSASLNYSLNECKADIVIYGNSRAQHNYDSRILSDSLKMSCYNAGIDGGHSILLPYAQIEILLKRYSPKIIIIEFNPNSMDYNEQDFEKLSILLPYYKTYPELRQLILKKSPWERLKLISEIYPYNSLIINILRFNTNLDTERSWSFNGYIPIKGKVMNRTMVKSTNSLSKQSLVSRDKVRALEDIIKMCKIQNVQLFLINSPYYCDSNEYQVNNTISRKQVIDLIEGDHVNFIDYNNNPHFIGQMDLFADRVHLNELGATKYTKLICTHIKQRLTNKL